MRVRTNGAGSKHDAEWDALSSPMEEILMRLEMEEILMRLEAIERRLSRLETDAALRLPESGASNEAKLGSPPASQTIRPDQTDVEAAAPAPMAAPPITAAAPARAARPSVFVEPATVAEPLRSKVAVGDEPKSYSPTAIAPATERLNPLSRRRAGSDAPLPDLSQLDEKVEPKRGPAQRVQVTAAIEDYPRICTRIQELWGSPACEGYITNLVIDTRGNRKGFPPEVMEELLYLGRLARALVILGIDGDLWDSLDRVGDRR